MFWKIGNTLLGLQISVFAELLACITCTRTRVSLSQWFTPQPLLRPSCDADQQNSAQGIHVKQGLGHRTSRWLCFLANEVVQWSVLPSSTHKTRAQSSWLETCSKKKVHDSLIRQDDKFVLVCSVCGLVLHLASFFKMFLEEGPSLQTCQLMAAVGKSGIARDTNECFRGFWIEMARVFEFFRVSNLVSKPCQ